MKIEFKSYKSCRANEGDAFSCTMYMDGVKAASITYDGNGGAYNFNFSVAGKMHGMRSGPLYDKFKEYVAGLPPWKSDWASEDGKEIWHDHTFDTAIGPLLDEMLENKQIRGWCKTKVVFKVKGDKPGEYRMLKAQYVGNEAQVKAHLAKQYGEDLVEILNERFV